MSEHTVTVERDVPCVARDGTVLRSDVYRPAGDGRHPILLGRTCYGKGTWGRWIEPERTAAEGWVVVINDTRGSFASEGEFNPFFHDATDGYDVVEWCAAQPWSNGRVGMFGSSAPGFVQLLAAAERPPHLVAIAPMQTWTSHGRGCVYDPGGAFMLFTAQWATLMAAIDPEHRLGPPSAEGYEQRLAAVRAAHADPGAWAQTLPLSAIEHLPRPWFDFFHRWLEHPEHDDFWAPLDLARRFGEIEVPALHLVGLFDKFRYGSTRNYRGLRDGAASAAARDAQRLVIGPWTHGIPVEAKDSDYPFPPEATVDVRALVLRWYAHWLRGEGDGLLAQPRVRVWVQGADRWRDTADWPPPEARALELHLRGGGAANGSAGDGRLEPAAAPGAEPADALLSDPADPVPTTVGAGTRSEGPIDVQEIERRADVLVYTGAPLEADLEVMGEIVVRLWGAVDGPDADWVVTLADVAPDGSSRRVTEGMLRARYRDGHDRALAVPAGEPIEYEIPLRPTANRFAAGHRIRLDVAGTSFAQYERPPAAARQQVFHDAERRSRVVLPVVPSG
jgi:putative CocE/NonD family hydrolase